MAGRRVNDVVRTVDLMPTVLSLLRLPIPPNIAGTSLVDRMISGTGATALDTYSETMYPRDHFGWSELRALREGSLKFVAAPRPELYDLATDPGEEQSLIARQPALAARLAARLRALEQAGWDSFTATLSGTSFAAANPPVESGRGMCTHYLQVSNLTGNVSTDGSSFEALEKLSFTLDSGQVKTVTFAWSGRRR